MDRFDAMTAFALVADERSFARAARRLGVSPSAVTRLVAGLEDRLGIALLTRTTRAVTLTDAGARYLERARGVLASLDEAESSARAERAAPRGKLVVAAPAVFGRREVAPLVCDFLERFPDVSVELVLADRLVSLVDEGVDVAVRIGELADSSLRARVVGRTRRVLVASPGYLAARGRPRRVADLEGHATIQFTAVAPAPEWRFPREGKELRVPIRPALVTNSADAAIERAARGGGVAMVLSYQVAELVRSGALEIVLPSAEPPPVPIQIVHAAGRFLASSARAFIDLAASTRRWSFVELAPAAPPVSSSSSAPRARARASRARSPSP